MVESMNWLRDLHNWILRTFGNNGVPTGDPGAGPYSEKPWTKYIDLPKDYKQELNK